MDPTVSIGDDAASATGGKELSAVEIVSTDTDDDSIACLVAATELVVTRAESIPAAGESWTMLSITGRSVANGIEVVVTPAEESIPATGASWTMLSIAGRSVANGSTMGRFRRRRRRLCELPKSASCAAHCVEGVCW
jgi:hypothetical protein